MTNPKMLCVVALGLLLMISFVPSARSSPPTAVTSPDDGASIEIENIAPMRTVRGYVSRNRDNTYFPGDFFRVELKIRSAGKRGKAVTDGWKRFENLEEMVLYTERLKPWYRENKAVLENKNGGRGGWTENKQEAERKVSEMLSRPDVVDAGLESFVNRDYDWRPWWVINGSRENGQWYEHKDQAERKADYYLEYENASDAGVERKLADTYREWRPWWIDRDWKLELLKLEPEAHVFLYNATGLGNPQAYNLNVELSPWSVDLKKGEYVAENVFVKLGVDTSPGRYVFEVEMRPPEEGYNNPYADVQELSVKENAARVVEYDPVVRQIPYLCPYWKPESTDWMVQKPNAVVTRYDGSRSENIFWRGWWTLENGTRGHTGWHETKERAEEEMEEALDSPSSTVENKGFERTNAAIRRRTVVSAISVKGSITKPLHANQMLSKWSAESPAFENENIPPNNLAVDQKGHVRLAKKPSGNYYRGGSLISSVLEPSLYENGEKGPPLWIEGGWKADTPVGTHVEVYARFGNTVEALLNTQEWTPIDSLEANYRKERYGQYRVVLCTEDVSLTPTLKKVRFELRNAGQLGTFAWAQRDWTGGPGYLYPKSTSRYVNPRWVQGGYYTYRDPLFYRPGDVIMREKGVPRTIDVRLVAERSEYFKTPPYSSIRLRLDPPDPENLPWRLRGKTSTIEKTPAASHLALENVLFRARFEGSWEIEGENVFVFVPKGEYLGSLGTVPERMSFKYDHENRYKKWRFFFYPKPEISELSYSELFEWFKDATGRVPKISELGYPEMFEWFEDAAVDVNVTFWFHQGVDDGDFKKDHGNHTFKRAFTSDLRWAPSADYQPVEVTAWELKDDLEDDVLEDPGMVLQDNVWKVDNDVEFSLTFTGMNDPENFLKMSRRAARQLAPYAENVENTLQGVLGSESFKERASEMGFPAGGVDVGAMRESLLSLAEMDNRMLSMILDDWVLENGGPQLISGRGCAVENVDYRIGGYYMISEEVDPPGENRENIIRTEPAALPFDPGKTADFDINVTGEGLAAEVESDGSFQATIKIYAPSRAGGLENAALYDTEGNLLTKRDFLMSSFGWLSEFPSLPGVGGEDSETKSISFLKWENSPTHLRIKMTNEWGASAEQGLEVSSGGNFPWGGPLNLKWLVLAVLAMILWTSFVRWWGEKKKRARRQG